MSDFPTSYQTYGGALLAAQLFGDPINLALADLGGMNSGATLTEEDTSLTVGETTTLGGVEYTVLGSGTLQPTAVSLLGITIGLSPAVDVVLLEDAGGNIIFMYPDGEPDTDSLLGLGDVVMVLDVEQVGYNLGTGEVLCFREGTMISVPEGERAIEDLRVGDLVADIHGQSHEVRFLDSYIADPADDGGRNPSVTIPENGFGAGVPHSDLTVTGQHRLYVPNPMAEGEMCLVPAKALIETGDAHVYHSDRATRFFHLLTRGHNVVRANGMGAETMYTGKMVLAAYGSAGSQRLAKALNVSVVDLMKTKSAYTFCRVGPYVRATQRMDQAQWMPCVKTA